MKAWVTRIVLHCYPKHWRDRYGTEFAALIDDERMSAWAIADILLAALRERLLRCFNIRDKIVGRGLSRRKMLLFAIPILILIGNAQFAYVSFRHANAAHLEVERASRTGNTDAKRFWSAMEAEEGGEYADSIHFGIGFSAGLFLIVSLVIWSRRNRHRQQV